MNLSDATVWKQLLEKDPKLKELAVKAGLENNPKRVQELNGCFAVNCGDGVINSEEERELAKYLFCNYFDDSNYQTALEERILVARSAGIKISNL